MSQKVEVKFDDERIKDFLKGVHSKLSKAKNGTSEYVGLISANVFADVMDHFSSETGSDGKWQPWSKIYKEHLNEIGRGGNKILQWNGRLRQSFKPTDYKASTRGITWFNDARTKSGFPYAAAHDEGGGSLPAREFMWLSQGALEKIADQTLAFILEKDKG